jgi:hypothetical protein
MKLLRLLLLAGTLAAPSLAQDHTKAAALFRMGEMYEAESWASYYQAVGENLPVRFKESEELAAQLGAPARVLDDFRNHHASVSKFSPLFPKPWGQWAPADQRMWSALPRYESWWKEWLEEKGTDPLFWWWSGRLTFRLWFVYHKDIAAGIYGIDVYKAQTQALAQDTLNLLVHAGYAPVRGSASPEVLAQLTIIANGRLKISDPSSGGFGLPELTQMADAAKQVRALAKDGKLLK